MKFGSIEVITFFAIYLYNLFLINYYGKIAEFKLNKKLIVVLFPIVMSLIYFSIITKLIYLPIAYMINFLMYILTFKIIFNVTVGSAYILSICQTIQIIIIRDIILGIIILLSENIMIQTSESYQIYMLVSALTRIFVLTIGIIFDKEVYTNKVKMMLLYRKKIRLIILTITSLIVILSNLNYAYYYYYVDDQVITIMMILTRICIYFCFYFAIGMAFKSIQWVEEVVFYKTNLLNLEHNNNINKKIDEYSNLLKIYNHDFKNILFNIKDSIEVGDTEKAKEIILSFDNKIQAVTNYNKNLSNNSLINAILNRLYEKCNYENINFDSDCYIPNELSISDIELINIFNNLSSNALEACIKQDNSEKRWISFKSYVKDNNLIIYQSNSFNGYIKFRNDKLVTTKKNKKLHGIGVESIKYIVNEVNGMALIKVDEEKREFKFLIKIPLK